MIFVYDRNILDISIAKEISNKIQTSGFFSLTDTEKQQWQAGLKGSLNYTDLNRIEKNSRDIAQIINVSIDTPKVDWEMTDIPTQKDFLRIRDNVQKIRQSGYALENTPYTPILPLNRYEKINDIEKILHDIYKNISPEIPEYYIDEIYIDESIGVI